MYACELHMQNSTHLNLDLLFIAQNVVMLEHRKTAVSQNHHSCQFADMWVERGYYNESDVILYMK